jgi:hypothetical protein
MMKKEREFNDLKLGQISFDEFVNKFVSPQWPVPYLKEKKSKIQHFISCLPQSYKDKIKFETPKTMDEAIRKAQLCYWQFKQTKKINK